MAYRALLLFYGDGIMESLDPLERIDYAKSQWRERNDDDLALRHLKYAEMNCPVFIHGNSLYAAVTDEQLVELVLSDNDGNFSTMDYVYDAEVPIPTDLVKINA